jgi:SAM-dependent methyltransferase
MKNFFKRLADEWQNKGERPFLYRKIEKIDPVYQFAYKYASKKVKGKSVLDFGCGGGYGTEYLARFTQKNVFGFDIDQKVIKDNRRFFSGIKNLSFENRKSKLGKFDVIVCFQVIEHLENKNQFRLLKEIKKKYLKRKGIFLLSTVNKHLSSYKLKKPMMPFHSYEYTPEELEEELAKLFPQIKIYGQITEKLKKKVTKGKFQYDRDYHRGDKMKFFRFVSQYEIVRKIARMAPLAVKSFVFRYQEGKPEKHLLVKRKKLIENSGILIVECQ